MDLFYTIIIIIFAVTGSFLAGYIAKIKNKGKSLVCILGHNCDPVIHSRFSKFFGLKNEMIGLLYYIVIALFYISTLIFNIPQNFVFYLLLIVVLAFIFSLYLLFTQLILLKKWCTTCLGSFIISFIILISSFLGFEASFGAYLFGIQDILQWIFMISIFVGIIVTSLHAKIFIRFLRDFEISRKESKRLAMFSHTALVAIAVTFLSGLSITLTDIYGNFTESSKFMVILIVLGILVAYEVIVNMVIAPKLVDIHFNEHPNIEGHHHTMLRKTSFSFVAIGVVSWYVLLLLSTIHFYEYSTLALLVLYIVLLLISIAIAMYAEHLYYKKSLYSKRGNFEKSRK